MALDLNGKMREYISTVTRLSLEQFKLGLSKALAAEANAETADPVRRAVLSEIAGAVLSIEVAGE